MILLSQVASKKGGQQGEGDDFPLYFALVRLHLDRGGDGFRELTHLGGVALFSYVCFFHTVIKFLNETFSSPSIAGWSFDVPHAAEKGTKYRVL